MAVSTGATQPPARCQRSKRAAPVPGSPSGDPGWWTVGSELTQQPPPMSTAEHRHPEFFFSHVRPVLADDLPLVHREDAVGEREDFVQLERHEEDGTSLVAFFYEALA